MAGNALDFDGPGFIYAITHFTFPGWVKIGRATNPNKRLLQYQTGCPFKGYRLEFAIMVERCRATEAFLHNKFVDSQSPNTEWFQVSVEDVLAALEPLAKEDDPHDAE